MNSTMIKRKFSSLMECSQLNDIIKGDVKNLRILDCIYPTKKGYSNFKRKRIPNSLFLDVGGLRDKSTNLSLSFPQPNQFKTFLKDLNISKRHTIVFYDQYGIFSSPRAWFIFKAYQFPNIWILNGGLPKWIQSGYDVDNRELTDEDIPQYKSKFENLEIDKEINELKYDPDVLVKYEEFMKISQNNKEVILDTRPNINFKLDSIPNSKNIPFESFVKTSDHTLKNKEELTELFNQADIDTTGNKNIVSSCGIGLSACIGILALNEIGIKNVRLYNGSYEEYANKIKIN
jgi:thiosulfate/3-mercaptopyruvate sulfurtransferase